MKINREKLEKLLVTGERNLLILGDRGLGKSTFVRNTFPKMNNAVYLNLLTVEGAEDLKLYLIDECNDLNIKRVSETNLLSFIKEYTITLVLDEWEKLIEEKDLIVFIMELLNTSTRFILIGFHPLGEIESLFPQIQTVQMPAFTKEEAFEIINNSGLVLTNKAKDLLYSETKGHGRYLDVFLIHLKSDESPEVITDFFITNCVDKVKKSIGWR